MDLTMALNFLVPGLTPTLCVAPQPLAAAPKRFPAALLRWGINLKREA